jgi:hypothetical protein
VTARDDVAQDPDFVAAEKALLAAMRTFRRTNSELRALYMPSSHPSQIVAAEAQLRAHQATDALHHAIEAYVRYSWGLVPHSSRPDHLASIDAVRAAHQERLKKARVDMRKELEERLRTDDGQIVTIIVKDPHRSRTFLAEPPGTTPP